MIEDDHIPSRRSLDFVTPDRLELMEQRLTTLFERKFDALATLLDKKTTELQFADHNMSARQDAFALQMKELADSFDRKLADVKKDADDRFAAMKEERDEWRDRIWRGVALPIIAAVVLAVLVLAFARIGLPR